MGLSKVALVVLLMTNPAEPKLEAKKDQIQDIMKAPRFKPLPTLGAKFNKLVKDLHAKYSTPCIIEYEVLDWCAEIDTQATMFVLTMRF